MSGLKHHLIIDIDAGVRRFGGKHERYMNSLIKFAEGLPGKKVDWESPDLQREVHSIKGVAGNLGVTSLYNEAIEFEQMIMTGESTEAEYNKFYDTCAAAGRAIAERFDDREQAHGKPLPEGPPNEYAALSSRLIVALKEGDITMSEEVLARFKSKCWPTACNMDRVYKLVESYEFDEALRLLGE